MVSPYNLGAKAELVRTSQIYSLVGRKKKGKDSRGPAITRSGAGLVPIGEVPSHVVKPGSGHPASISNFSGQILYAGEPTSCRSRVVRTGGNTGEEEQVSESEQGVEPEQTEDSARTVSEARSLSQGDTRQSVETVPEVQGGAPPKKKRRVTKLSELRPKPVSGSSAPALPDSSPLEAPVPDAVAMDTTEAVHLPSPHHSPVRAEGASSVGAGAVEINRGEQVVESIIGEGADEEGDEDMDAAEVDLREWARSAFPVQVEDLCTGIDSTIAKFAKEQASSSIPAVSCTALIPSVQVDNAATTSSSQQQSCFDEAKFSSIQRCKETTHLGVDPTDLLAAHAELGKFGIDVLYQFKSRIDAYLMATIQHVDEVNKKHSRVVQALSEVKNYHYELKRKSKKLKQLTTLASNAVMSWNDAENKVTELTNDKKELTKDLSEAMDRINRIEGEVKKAKEAEERLKLAEETARTDRDTAQNNLNFLTKKFEDLNKKWEKEVIDRQGLERKLGTTDSNLILEQQKCSELQASLDEAKTKIADQDMTILGKDLEIEQLKKQIAELKPLTNPYHHVLNWVQQDAYYQASSFTQSFAGPDAGQTIRKAVLAIDPNFPLDSLRVFPTERIKKDGSTMVLRSNALPPIYFDSDNLDREYILDIIGSAMSKNLMYSSPDPEEDEVLLPSELYTKFRKDYETCLRKRARMQACQEQGLTYESSDDDDDDATAPPVQTQTAPSSSGQGGKASLS